MKSLLEARVGQAVTLLTYTPEHDEAQDKDIPAWIPGPVVRAVVTSANSGENADVGEDTMNRRKFVRLFSKVQASGRDRVVIEGETYEIDGIPNITRMVGGQWLTTFFAVKEGTSS